MTEAKWQIHHRRGLYPLPPRKSGEKTHFYPLPSIGNAFLEAAKRSRIGCIPWRPLHEREHQGKGAPTRGWHDVYPEKGVERHDVDFRCGPECFLGGESEGYPICTKMEVKARNQKWQCLPLRQGEQAAFNRARQTRNEALARLDDEIMRNTCAKSVEELSSEDVDEYLTILSEITGNIRH